MVTRAEREVYDRVLTRDRMMALMAGGVWDVMGNRWAALLASDSWTCVAPIIDPSLWGTCSGEMERDHVHTHTGGTKSKRPPTTMETLVILCHHHHQDGWATSHRPEIRTYIKEANERWRTIRS